MTATSHKLPQVEVVDSFEALLSTPFYGQKNSVCWARDLGGDFGEIVRRLKLMSNITEISKEMLLGLSLSIDGGLARAQILADLELLTDAGASPSLNLLKCYERDDEFHFISTDVYSFHVDRSPIPTDTFLCTYHGAASDIIANAEVEQKILVPEIRQKLMALYAGPAAGFEDFLKENYFDLHYQIKPGARPINLGVGNLWKLAVDHPDQSVLPCVHRAPKEKEGELRLLLIC